MRCSSFRLRFRWAILISPSLKRVFGRDQSTEFGDDTASRRKTARTRSSQRFLLLWPENENPQAPFAERGYLEPPQAGGSMRLPFAHVLDVRQDFLSKREQALIPS